MARKARKVARVAKIKGIRSFSTHKESPFHSGSEIIIEGKKGTSRWKNVGGRVEISTATPLYKDDLRKHYFEATKDFFTFSNNAKQVLMYLDAIADFKTLTAEVDFERAVVLTGYKSEQSIFTGMAELLELGFIARSKNKSVYFLSPMIFTADKQILNTHHFFEKSLK